MTGTLFLLFYGFMMAAACAIALWETTVKRTDRKRKAAKAMEAQLQNQRRIIESQQRQIKWYRSIL